ncbi:MAG: hypothetical protein WCG47_08870 [Dermatophilaceae bacterium]
MRSAAPDAVNRTVLLVIGVLLAAASALGLVAGIWGLPGARPDDPVVPAGWAAYTHDHAWVWWAIAVVCLLVAWIGLRWLLAQLRTDRLARMDLTADARDGLTVVHAGAIGDAVQAQASRVPGVARASASLQGSARPRLHVVVDLTHRADIAQVRDALETGVVDDARNALGQPQLPVELELRLARARSAGRDLS